MRRRPEPTIALINIVFLMLIFFLVAGTISPLMDGEINLVTLADLEGKEPAETLAIHPDGRMTWAGEDVTAEGVSLPEDGVLRLLPDRDLPALELIQIASALQANGAGEIIVVTERGLE